MFELIPAIDLMDGRYVRLAPEGRFDAAPLVEGASTSSTSTVRVLASLQTRTPSRASWLRPATSPYRWAAACVRSPTWRRGSRLGSSA